MTRKIQLSQGKVTLVDNSDYEFLNRWKWSAFRRQRCTTFYVVRNAPQAAGRRNIYMHRILLGLQDPETGESLSDREGDHRNGNGLDNRRVNLRALTHKQNAYNQRRGRTRSSRYKGVSKLPNGRWRAQIKVNYRQVFLGHFRREDDAAHAYDVAARVAWGDLARTNFPFRAKVPQWVADNTSRRIQKRI